MSLNLKKNHWRSTSVEGRYESCCCLRIRDVYPWSEFFHPGSRIRIKELKYFNHKKLFLSSRKYDPGCFIPDPDLLPIPDHGSRDQKGTGSRIRIIILNTDCCILLSLQYFRKDVKWFWFIEDPPHWKVLWTLLLTGDEAAPEEGGGVCDPRAAHLPRPPAPAQLRQRQGHQEVRHRHRRHRA